MAAPRLHRCGHEREFNVSKPPFDRRLDATGVPTLGQVMLCSECGRMAGFGACAISWGVGRNAKALADRVSDRNLWRSRTLAVAAPRGERYV